MQTEESILKFATSFFNHLKCDVKWDGKILNIGNIPTKFEKYVGKTGPYEIAFNLENKTKNTELLTKGNYFLKAMSEFLDNGAKMTLLKLKFNVNSKTRRSC